MKFTIVSLKCADDIDTYSILKQYPILKKKYGAKKSSYRFDAYRGGKGTKQCVSVDIKSLEQLLELYDDVGKVIITKPWFENDKYKYEIKIYDDYME